jgi:broad specificity phosphatase PhoE
MKLYLIRHGLTPNNKLGRTNGQRNDESLSEEGREQALAVIPQIPRTVTHIYCSDLKRARETAEIINNELKLPISYHKELRERDFGDLTNMTWPEIGEKYGQELLSNDVLVNYDFRPYGGESAEDVTKRLKTFLEFLKKQHKPDDHVLVVTHGGILKIMHYIYFGKQYREIENATVQEFEI